MIVKLLTEQHLEFLSLKGGCTGWFESTLDKLPHCWKSHALAQYYNTCHVEYFMYYTPPKFLILLLVTYRSSAVNQCVKQCGF